MCFDAKVECLLIVMFFVQVLSEATASKQARKSRAQGLQVLGRLFQQAALAANANAPQVCCSHNLISTVCSTSSHGCCCTESSCVALAVAFRFIHAAPGLSVTSL